MAGYSNTPLAKKLGIKEGHRMLVINQPGHYFKLFENFSSAVAVDDEPVHPPYDVVHFFTSRKAELLQRLPLLKQIIVQNGMIWVSWPKGKSELPKDLNENDVRQCMLSIDMVDVKVCAVDNDWSGLKGVIRVEKRK